MYSPPCYETPQAILCEKTGEGSVNQSTDEKKIQKTHNNKKNIPTSKSPESTTKNVPIPLKSVEQRKDEMAELRAFSKNNKALAAKEAKAKAEKLLTTISVASLEGEEEPLHKIQARSRRAKQIEELKSFSTKMCKSSANLNCVVEEMGQGMMNHEFVHDDLEPSFAEENKDHAPSLGMDKEEFEGFVKELRMRAGISPEDFDTSQNYRSVNPSQARLLHSAASLNKQTPKKRPGSGKVGSNLTEVAGSKYPGNSTKKVSQERRQTRDVKVMKRGSAAKTTQMSSSLNVKSPHVTTALHTTSRTRAGTPGVYSGSSGGSVSEAALDRLFSTHASTRGGNKVKQSTSEVEAYSKLSLLLTLLICCHRRTTYTTQCHFCLGE